MGRTSAAYTMGITLLILATLWKPAQKSAEQTSGCRFSSLRHCGRLSGGPFKRTTSRKRNGRGTPSFSSKGCSKKVALPGPERTGFARTFALLHKTSATIAGVAGNGHSVLAPAPPKETQWSALQPGLPVKEPYSLPPRQAGLPHLPIPTLPDAGCRLRGGAEDVRGAAPAAWPIPGHCNTQRPLIVLFRRNEKQGRRVFCSDAEGPPPS